MTKMDVTINSYQPRFRSPTFFYGVWGHCWKTSVIDPKTNEVIQKNGDNIPCKYKTRDEVIEILKGLYDGVCQRNPTTKYPSFEECLRKDITVTSGVGGSLDGEGLFINMIPIL